MVILWVFEITIIIEIYMWLIILTMIRNNKKDL